MVIGVMLLYLRSETSNGVMLDERCEEGEDVGIDE